MNHTNGAAKGAAGHVPLSEIPGSGRTAKSEMVYQEAKKNGITKDLRTEPALQEWQYWRLIENRFPYDMIFDVHHLLIPLSGATDRDRLFQNEADELRDIIANMDRDNAYDALMDNFQGRRSVLGLYHIHLVTWHKNRADYRL